MAVLITAEVPGQTKEGYDGMMVALAEPLRQAKGFIMHGAGSDGATWRVFEVWETPEAAADFFATYIHPNLPPGIKPKRTVLELHSLLTS